MAVPKRKHSKGRTKRKRAPKMLKKGAKLVECRHCKHKKLPHRICPKCGKY